MIARLFVCAALASACYAQNTYTISGTVVAESSGKPLRHVMVMINEAARQNPHQAAVVTGEDGRFVFSNLPRGKFALSAQKQGGFLESFRQTGRYSTAIVTGPGLNSENILFSVTQTGSIHGTVLDEENEPVRDAQVTLFRRGIYSGRWATVITQYETTGSSGTFHFARVMPGTFFIAVEGRPWYAQNGPLGLNAASERVAEPEFDVTYPVTYYGGTTDPNAASPITVTEGASASVEIALHPVTAAHVRVPNGTAMNISAIGVGGQQIPGGVTQLMGTPDGTEFRIAPGRYELETNNGKRTVEIGGDTTLNGNEAPGATISGRLSVEGEEHPDFGKLLLFSIDRPNVEAQVAADGSFEGKNAEAGHYEVQMPNAAGYYVKSVAIGDRMSPDAGFDVAEGAAMKISVVAAKAVEKIEGAVFKDGAPFAGAMVLLIPQNLRRTDWIRRDQSDSDGTFAMANVAPGRYTLIAIDDGREFAYAEPGALDAYLSGGQVIEIPPANGTELKTNVQHRQR